MVPRTCSKLVWYCILPRRSWRYSTTQGPCMNKLRAWLDRVTIRSVVAWGVLLLNTVKCNAVINIWVNAGGYNWLYVAFSSNPTSKEGIV